MDRETFWSSEVRGKNNVGRVSDTHDTIAVCEMKAQYSSSLIAASVNIFSEQVSREKGARGTKQREFANLFSSSTESL
jgi:hypothetical protein